MQHGAPGKHRNTLLPDIETLEEKFPRESEVRNPNSALQRSIMCSN